MTLDELINSLPNGLHDAKLLSLKIDYAQRLLGLDLQLWVGDTDAPTVAAREACQPARVTFKGLVFCAVEPPDARSPFNGGSALTIDAGTGAVGAAPGALPPVPAGAFLAWIFVAQWNAFIRVAARDVELEWLAAPAK